MHYPFACGVLGPLNLVLAGGDAVPNAQKQRQVLSLLLVNDSQVVQIPSFIEELWGEAPPKSAVTIVQTYVLGIRKNIARNLGISSAVVAKQLLRTANNGYVIDTSSGDFDLRAYRRLVAAARLAVQAGEDERAVHCFREADALWRGRVLVDVGCGSLLAAEVAQLEHARLFNQEMRIEAELRLGRDREVCADLAGMIIRYPFNERLHAYLMFALCRSGWRTRALEVYHDLRRSMIDELGLEPSPMVQRLHRQILELSDELAAEELFAPC